MNSRFLNLGCAHLFLLLMLSVAVSAGCKREVPTTQQAEVATPKNVTPAAPVLDWLALALVRHEGEATADKEIRKFQEQVRLGINRQAALERLGWAYVAKAHESFDPGYYKLAEGCANVLENEMPGCAEGMLLRGHILENLHCFKEAEVIARELTAKRGLPYDFALLGDSLMEQGRLKEAIAAYQKMVDLRPDLQSFSRIAHVRWLTGDLAGAIEMMEAAVSASSPRDADSAAWVNSRLATLQLHSGETEAARQACESALEHRPNYPPALLLRGKMALQQDDFDAAVSDLQSAAQQNPLPEYQWALAEALRAAGCEDEASVAENLIATRGETADPRTLSLYLATRGENPDLAVRLAEQELKQREDVFTHDALAWALSAAGRNEEARVHMKRAMAEGTDDPRLYFHATMIATRAGASEEAQELFITAAAMQDLLLPSEQALLLKLPDSFSVSQVDADAPSPPSEATIISASGL